MKARIVQILHSPHKPTAPETFISVKIACEIPSAKLPGLHQSKAPVIVSIDDEEIDVNYSAYFPQSTLVTLDASEKIAFMTIRIKYGLVGRLANGFELDFMTKTMRGRILPWSAKTLGVDKIIYGEITLPAESKVDTSEKQLTTIDM